MKIHEKFDFKKYIEDKFGLNQSRFEEYEGGIKQYTNFCPICNGDDFSIYYGGAFGSNEEKWSCNCLDSYLSNHPEITSRWQEGKNFFNTKTPYHSPVEFFMAVNGCLYQTAVKKIEALIQPQEQEHPKDDGLKFATFGQLLKEESIIKPTFLVDRLIYKNAINLLVGDPKTYKTYVAIDIMTSLVTGEPVFQTHDVEKEGTVLFISPEFDTKERIIKSLTSKLKQWNRSINEVADKIYMPYFRNSEFTAWSKDGEKIKALIRQVKPDLVILDPLTYIFDGEIEKNEPVKNFFKEIKDLINECGTTFLITHHTNRMQVDKRMNKVSGSSSITRYADAIMYLEQFREDVEQDINKSDAELNKEDKTIKLIKGTYRHGGEGYKYHKIIFSFNDEETQIHSERYSNKEEYGIEIKNTPQKETNTEIEKQIQAALSSGKLGVEFTVDNVLSVLENNSGKSNATFKKYCYRVLSKMAQNKKIYSVKGKGYTTQPPAL